MKPKAVILLSGGLDSATTLYFAKPKYDCYCLIFDYGQRHKREITSAQKIAKLAKSEYLVLNISLPWSKSVLTKNSLNLPVRGVKEIFNSKTIPATYVPARNTIFLAYAASVAESIGVNRIFIGANAIDYSGYPDCRPGYLTAIERALKLGTTNKKLRIIAPLIKKTKAEIIKLAVKLGVPLKYTWSCYAGGKTPCGVCDSCKLRQKGFAAAGIDDPIMNYKDLC